MGQVNPCLVSTFTRMLIPAFIVNDKPSISIFVFNPSREEQIHLSKLPISLLKSYPSITSQISAYGKRCLPGQAILF